MAKCGMCMGRGSYDDPPWGIRVCVLCHGTGHDDPNVELWDRKGNVRHDAVERFGEARAQMQRIEQEHAAKSEFQREVEKLGASAATVAEPSKMPDTSDDTANLLHRVLTIAGFSSEDAEYQKLTDALIGAAQQQAEPHPSQAHPTFQTVSVPNGPGTPSAQTFDRRIACKAGQPEWKSCEQPAEPGADERAAFEEYRSHLAEGFRPGPHSIAFDDFCAGYRAAQSGQRAGVAEGWQLVPIHPTKTMLDAIAKAVSDGFVDGMVWRKALAAAPTQQQEGE